MRRMFAATAAAAVLTAMPAFPRAGIPAVSPLPQTQLRESSAIRDAAALRRSILELVTAVLASGFIKADVANSLEIENNFYGFFVEASEGVRGTFEKEPGGKDAISFERGLLDPGAAPAAGESIPNLPDRRALQTVVHELFHDFWFNRLTPDERRAFSAETKRFFAGFAAAGTKKARRRFLAEWGYKFPQDEDTRVWRDLWEARSKYSSPSFFGPELFSFVAALSFGGSIVIPDSLRPFYQSLISEPYLQREE